MPGPFDALMTLMGRPDPTAQLMAALGQAPGQPGSNAPGPVPGVTPPPAGAPNPAAQGQGQGQGATTPATMPNGQQAPMAFQSPSDLSQMYMAMVQRQQASNQFNNGLALMAASAYPGRHPEMIINAMRGMNQPDPAEMFGNLMKLQTYGQEQQARQNFLNAAPDIARQLNMTPAEVMAYGPDAIKLAAQAQLPPEAMRNWNYAKNQYIQAHAGDMGPDGKTPIGAAGAGADFEKQFPMSMAIMGGMPGMSDATRQMNLDQLKFRQNNPGQPLPSWLQDSGRYNAYNKDIADAQGNFDAFNKQAQVGIDLINQLKSDPDTLDKALTWMNKFGPGGLGMKPEMARNLSSVLPGAIDQKTYQAVEAIDQLGGQIYAEGFKSTGSRRTQQEVNAIVEGLSQLKSTGYDAQGYINNALNPVLAHIQHGIATNYGAAQQLDSVPDELKSQVGKIYLPGGDLYGGLGGKWANEPNLGIKPQESAPPNAQQAGGGGPGAAVTAPTSSGGGGAKAATVGQKLSPDELADAQAKIKQFGRDYVIKFLQGKGYDTTGL